MQVCVTNSLFAGFFKVPVQFIALVLQTIGTRARLESIIQNLISPGLDYMEP